MENKSCTVCDFGKIEDGVCNSCGSFAKLEKGSINPLDVLISLADYNVIKLFLLNMMAGVIFFGFLFMLTIIYEYKIELLYVFTYVGVSFVFFLSAYRLGIKKG